MNTEITDTKNRLGWVCFDAECPRCVNLARRFGPLLRRLAWVFALMPAVLAMRFGRTLPGWIWMWVIALALFIGAKGIIIFQFLRTGRTAARKRLLAFALLWPGMDARAFCEHALVPAPPIRDWCSAAAKTVLGATLVWVGVPLTGTTHPLLTGWTGMLGIVLLLHFGLFHLLALLWRTLGINARPIMQSPAKSTSLSRFWGGSWNAAFTDLMHEHVFKGLAKHSGAPTALFTVFLISGGLHELVISLPARAGYGLPTTYFMLQAFGALFERSRFGRALGLGSGMKGWCFVAVVTGLPAFWLFHPPFVHNVILPMLKAMGAT